MISLLKKSLKAVGILISSPVWLPVVSLQYAYEKIRKSGKNLLSLLWGDDYKYWSSLLRVCSAMGGTTIGIQKGLLLSAHLSPVVSVLPSALPYICGFWGGAIGIGLAVLSAKIISKWASRFFVSVEQCCDGDLDYPVINPNNPDKYKFDYEATLSDQVTNQRHQKIHLSNAYSILKKLYEMKQENKKQMSFWGKVSSLFATPKDRNRMARNEDYNQAIFKLTHGDFEKEDRPYSQNITIRIQDHFFSAQRRGAQEYEIMQGFTIGKRGRN